MPSGILRQYQDEINLLTQLNKQYSQVIEEQHLLLQEQQRLLELLLTNNE